MFFLTTGNFVCCLIFLAGKMIRTYHPTFSWLLGFSSLKFVVLLCSFSGGSRPCYVSFQVPAFKFLVHLYYMFILNMFMYRGIC